MTATKQPTEAQLEAGNYKKAKRFSWRGLRIVIETPKGSRRRPEWPKMPADYGDIKRTEGADGDPVDVFVGPDLASDLVVVIDQVTPGGRFDEHKVIIGHKSKADAVACYRKAYAKGWKVGPVTTMTVDQFKAWLDKGRTDRRIHNQVSRYAAIPQFATFAEMVDYYATQMSFDWDESKHPRDDAGKFATKQGTTSRGKVGPAGLTKQEAIEQAAAGSKAKLLTYSQRVRATGLYLGNRGTWEAVPVKDMRTVSDGKGGNVTVPVFDMPSGYKPVDTPWSSEGTCSLCGTNIKNHFHIQNDETRQTMNVGSECVQRFTEAGQTGKQAAKASLAAKRRQQLSQLERAANIVFNLGGYQVQRRTTSGGVFDKREWARHTEHGREAENLWNELSAVMKHGKANERMTAAKRRGLQGEETDEYYDSDRRLANWFKAKGDKVPALLKKAQQFIEANKGRAASEGLRKAITSHLDRYAADDPPDTPAAPEPEPSQPPQPEITRIAKPHPHHKTDEFKSWFGKSKVKEPGKSRGKPLTVYHGAQRPDRVAGEFKPERATSGPMAFFTTDPDIASSYTKKKDTSRLEQSPDDPATFTFNGVKLGTSSEDEGVGLTHDVWHSMTPQQRVKLRQILPLAGVDPETDEVTFTGEHALNPQHFDYLMKREHRGNPINTLFDMHAWGSADVDAFKKIMTAAGIPFEHDDPWEERGGVYPVHLSIQKPLKTNKIPKRVMRALEAAAQQQPPPEYTEGGADFWDKRMRDPIVWLEELQKDYEQGENSHAWTSIPDWVTETLRGLGYDGIHDTGGKGGGATHDVWIPFAPGQVKSATGNRGTYDPEDPRINYGQGYSSFGEMVARYAAGEESPEPNMPEPAATPEQPTAPQAPAPTKPDQPLSVEQGDDSLWYWNKTTPAGLPQSSLVGYPSEDEARQAASKPTKPANENLLDAGGKVTAEPAGAPAEPVKLTKEQKHEAVNQQLRQTTGEEDFDLADWIEDDTLHDFMHDELTSEELAYLVNHAAEYGGHGNLAGFGVDPDDIPGNNILESILYKQQSLGWNAEGEEMSPGQEDAYGGRYEPADEPDMDEYLRNQYPETDYITRSTGFILSDGTGLEMGDGRTRYDDHRAVIPTESSADRWGWQRDTRDGYSRWALLAQTLAKANAIRFMPESGDMTVFGSATPQQIRAIAQYFDDYGSEYPPKIEWFNNRGEQIASVEVPYVEAVASYLGAGPDAAMDEDEEDDYAAVGFLEMVDYYASQLELPGMDEPARTSSGQAVEPGATIKIPKYHNVEGERKKSGEDYTISVGPVHQGRTSLHWTDEAGNPTHKLADMPTDAVKHFENDLQGRVDVPEHPTHSGINAIREGKAEFLGKGDDGLAFDPGDGTVIKVSTGVPFVPENPGNVGPDRAKQELEDAVAMNNQMIEAGFGDLFLPQHYTEHGEKGFATMAKLDTSAKYSREQLDKFRARMKDLHDAGYRIGDDIQTGLDAEGNIRIFDTGKSGKFEDPNNYRREDEESSISRLYGEHGVEFFDDRKMDRNWQHHRNIYLGSLADGLWPGQRELEQVHSDYQKAVRGDYDALDYIQDDYVRIMEAGRLAGEELPADYRPPADFSIASDPVLGPLVTRSPVFKTWFGDWEENPKMASKVVRPDNGEPWEQNPISGEASEVAAADGTPIIMYHGTRFGEFPEFDPAKAGMGTSATSDPESLLYGPGFYFTSDPGVAEDYSKMGGGNVTETYDQVGNNADVARQLLLAAAVEEINAKAYQEALDKGEDDWDWERDYALKQAQNYRQRAADIANSFDNQMSNDEARWSYIHIEMAIDKLRELKQFSPHLVPEGTEEPTTENLIQKTVYDPRVVMKVYLNIRRPFDVNQDTIRTSELEGRDPPDPNNLDPNLWDDATIARIRERQQQNIQWSEHLNHPNPESAQMARDAIQTNNEFIRDLIDEPLNYWGLVEKMNGSKLEANNRLMSMGYDGITHIGGQIMGNKDHRVYIAFNPNQIKAVDNQGTFSPDDNRIRYQTQADQPVYENDIRAAGPVRYQAVTFNEMVSYFASLAQ